MTANEIRGMLLVKGARLCDVAEACKTSRGHVNNVLSGRVKSRRVASTISTFLGRPVDDLWPGQYPAKYQRTNNDAAFQKMLGAAEMARRSMEAA